jgi:hypothetical protein
MAMVEGALTDVVRERDQALHRLQVLAAEIRAHEQTVRRSVLSVSRRPADERLYRRLRQVNGGSDDGGEGDRRGGWRGIQPIARDGAGSNQQGRGRWA